MTQDVRWQKLDADLSEMLQALAETESVPVVVTAREGRLDDVVALIRDQGGEVRNVLERLGAVSAWLSGDAIGQLSREEIVDELELVQPTAPAL